MRAILERMRPVWLLSTAVLVVGLGAFGLLCIDRRSSPPPGDDLRALLTATNVRPMDASLQALPYLPTATPGGQPVAPSLALTAAARRILAAPESLWSDRVLAHATLRQWDLAIEVLEGTLYRERAPAPLLSDLSALYLARAEADSRPEDVPRALAHAERAIKADSALLAAWFNRALALDALHLRGASEQAWTDYLSRDEDSPWAAEGRLRLALRPPPRGVEWQARRGDLLRELLAPDTRKSAELELRKEYAQAVRDTLENELIPGWASDEIAGRPAGAIAKLRSAEALATALANAGGDPFWSDAVRTIERTTISGNRRRVTLLARAHLGFAKGTALYLEGRIHDAMQVFNGINAVLRTEASPLSLWVQAYGALALRASGQREAALRVLRTGQLATQRQRYGVLDGRASWFEGNICGELGRPDQAIAAFQRARAAFLAVDERAHAADAEGLIADQLSYLGRFAEAWTLQLSAVQRYWPARGRHGRVAMTSGTFLALADGLPEVALHFQDAALKLIAPTQQVAYPDGHLFRARVRARLGMRQGAETDLREAEGALDRISDPGMKRWMRAQLDWVRAEAAAALETSASPEATAEAVQFYRQGALPFETVRLLRTSARLHLTASRVDAAERDLVAAIVAFEKQRASMRDEALRVTPFEEGALAFEDMIRLQALHLGRWDRALEYAERARGGSLARSSRASLPRGVVVIYCVLLEDRLLVFGMTRDEVRAADTRRTRQEFAARLRRVSTLAKAGESDALRGELRRWYGDIIGPVSALLTRDAVVAVVPDGLLNDLPLAALVQPSGRYLIEDHAVVRASSLTSLVDASVAWQRSRARPTQALVAAPSAVEEGTRRVARLPSALVEASSVASQYPSAIVLRGQQATRRAFEAAVRSGEVIHFAGHAVANQRFPLLSRLLFTGSAEEGALSAFEIEHLPLDRTRIVTLAACEAARGVFVRGEGTLSLARPWLRAGVPSVVATIWEIDDTSARTLFSALHVLIARGVHPVLALQRIQRDASSGRVVPFRDWAGITAFGAAPGPDSSTS
jgi:CHAT domain-containing protein